MQSGWISWSRYWSARGSTLAPRPFPIPVASSTSIIALSLHAAGGQLCIVSLYLPGHPCPVARRVVQVSCYSTADNGRQFGALSPKPCRLRPKTRELVRNHRHLHVSENKTSKSTKINGGQKNLDKNTKHKPILAPSNT